MFERLALWIFDFRSQVLGILLALTVFAGFTAARITFEGAGPEAPPSDPVIREAAARYDAAFPQPRMLAVLATAEGLAPLESPEGTAWLDRLETVLRAVRNASVGAPPRDLALAPLAKPVRRMAADGRSALLEAPLRADAEPDLPALRAQLGALNEFPAGAAARARFQARIFEPVLQPPVILGWFSTMGPVLIGAGLLAAGLLAYSGSFVLTGLLTGAGVLAVVWQVGLWAAFGGHFVAGMRYVPMLIFMLTLGHGFTLARHIMRSLAAGASPAEAAASMVRRLAPAGGPALLAVAVALLAASFAPIRAAGATLSFAGLGVLCIPLALFVMLPLSLTRVPVDRPPPEAAPDVPARPARSKRSALSLRQASAGPQTILILAAALAVVAVLEARGRLFGPTDVASLALSNDEAWIATANDAARGPGVALASLSVIAATNPQTCMRFDTLDAVDRLSWRLANLPGVTAVESLPLMLRRMQADAHGGDPRWREVPRQPLSVLQAMVKIPDGAALFDSQCRTLALRVYAAPPFAGVLDAVDRTVARFNAENADSAVRFELAGGPLAPALAEHRLFTHYETAIFIAVIAALAGVVFLGLNDWRGAGAMGLIGLGLFLTAGWVAAVLPIGLTSRSVPLALLVLLLPADMAVYVLTGWRAPAVGPGGEPEPTRRRLWQRDGWALLSRALAMSLAFMVWLAGGDQLERSIGLLGIIITLAGTVISLFVVPAAAMLTERALAHRLTAPRRRISGALTRAPGTTP